MKKFVYAAFIPAAMLFSCNSGNSTADNPPTDTSVTAMNTTDNTHAKMETDTSGNKTSSGNQPVTDKDVVDFVNKASAVGMMEVELGKYAATNAASERVKNFGNMLVTDHTQAGDKLKAMAASNNITVPAELPKDKQMHVDMLEKKKGAAFDKEYIDMMVNGHKETIEMFKKASADLKDDSYKTFATMTLPVLQKHLDSAQAIMKGM